MKYRHDEENKRSGKQLFFLSIPLEITEISHRICIELVSPDSRTGFLHDHCPKTDFNKICNNTTGFSRPKEKLPI